MNICLVVAMARNRVIGRDNALPWHLPEDLRHFRRLTLGKPVIMGRRTFESIGKPLPERINIVISRSTSFRAPEGVIRVDDVDAALAAARTLTLNAGVTDCMVIGGARVYAALLPRAERIYLTYIDADVEGDTLFPELNWSGWREVSRCEGNANSATPLPYRFVVLERNRPAGQAPTSATELPK